MVLWRSCSPRKSQRVTSLCTSFCDKLSPIWLNSYRLIFSVYDEGGIKLKNPNIDLMDQDILYHLALGNESHDLVEMFGDVKVRYSYLQNNLFHQYSCFSKYLLPTLKFYYKRELRNKNLTDPIPWIPTTHNLIASPKVVKFHNYFLVHALFLNSENWRTRIWVRNSNIRYCVITKSFFVAYPTFLKNSLIKYRSNYTGRILWILPLHKIF